MINANTTYTREDLEQLGIGAILLRKARADGVKARKIGNLYWYMGSELIEWISKQPIAEKKSA
jgi:hypothetical protein